MLRHGAIPGLVLRMPGGPGQLGQQVRGMHHLHTQHDALRALVAEHGQRIIPIGME